MLVGFIATCNTSQHRTLCAVYVAALTTGHHKTLNAVSDHVWSLAAGQSCPKRAQLLRVQSILQMTDLILCSISNHTLAVCEANVGRRGAVTHVVGNNLNTVILPYSHTTAQRTCDQYARSSSSSQWKVRSRSKCLPIRSSKINANGGCLFGHTAFVYESERRQESKITAIASVKTDCVKNVLWASLISNGAPGEHWRPL